MNPPLEGVPLWTPITFQTGFPSGVKALPPEMRKVKFTTLNLCPDKFGCMWIPLTTMTGATIFLRAIARHADAEYDTVQ